VKELSEVCEHLAVQRLECERLYWLRFLLNVSQEQIDAAQETLVAIEAELLDVTGWTEFQRRRPRWWVALAAFALAAALAVPAQAPHPVLAVGAVYAYRLFFRLVDGNSARANLLLAHEIVAARREAHKEAMLQALRKSAV
jgi:chromate transport protein ChrA